MSKGFNFERNLPHQVAAVNSTTHIFNSARSLISSDDYVNNELDLSNKVWLRQSVTQLQISNNINTSFSEENIFDIQMETGTGKTYTYTKTMFELNKMFGIFKFIIVVPTLSIKAGTVNFLKNDSSKNHFRSEYGKNINTYVVDSSEKKGKKSSFPNSLSSFIRATKYGNNIHVLVINSQMVSNGKSLYKSYDINMFDKYSVPLEGIQACKTVMIIDEPHKFKSANKTFSKLLDFKSQFIIRYGATFDGEYYNLLYRLNAIDSFNQDLVKGISVHIDEFEAGKNEIIQLVSTDGTEATFKLIHGKTTKLFKLSKGQSLDTVHDEVQNLFIDKLNKTIVVLSNGLELKKGSKFNPFSYSNTLQERMLKKAVRSHFKLEQRYLMREVKIKPLSLIFIDDIASYRDNGSMAVYFEKLVENEIKLLLNNELSDTNSNSSFYIKYLEKSLEDIRATHGGYFSQDNSSSDEKIEKEINEIIHDKESLIDINNTRRFIFSKWTLREGWDNPNVFQIVKLRTSGSETSKLQEVGRGLRIPVNEYMERVKDEQFELQYFVDFTEKDFVSSLTDEINDFDDNTIHIFDKETQLKIMDLGLFNSMFDMKLKFRDSGIIDENEEYTENGYDILTQKYPTVFKKLKSDKITNAKNKKKTVSVRSENYHNLKELWEQINKKVIIEYKFEDENQVKNMFVEAISDAFNSIDDIIATSHTLNKVTATFRSQRSTYDDNQNISTLKYGEFLKLVAKGSGLNIESVHGSFILLNKNRNININDYLNMETVRALKQAFDEYLILNVEARYQIAYQDINVKIHPTKLTDGDGNPLAEINASDVGINCDSSITVSDKYLYDEAYFDSELERDNINPSTNNEIDEVVVYAKIPKGSIRIPIVGGFSYSPDFAYVVKHSNGSKVLNLVIETKDKKKSDLSSNERARVALAEKLYSNEDYTVRFEKQLSNRSMSNIIEGIIKEEDILF